MGMVAATGRAVIAALVSVKAVGVAWRRTAEHLPPLKAREFFFRSSTAPQGVDARSQASPAGSSHTRLR